MSQIYLNNHTLTAPHPLAIAKMKELYEHQWQSGPGVIALMRLHEAFGANRSDQFVFASSAQNAQEQFLYSYYFDEVKKSGRNHILSLPMGLSKIFDQLDLLGCVVKIPPLNAQGQLTRYILETFLRPRVGLLSMPWANPYTGVIHPIEDIAELCKERNIFFHVDASAVFGKIYFRFQDLNIDCLTFDGKLFHAPEGTAGMFCKRGRLFGMEDAHGPIPLLAALTLAADEAAHYFDHLCTETVRLRDRLEAGILEIFPQARVLFKDAERLPHVTLIAFPGIVSEAMIFILNRSGVVATPGVADELIECGVNPLAAEGSVSFSLSRYTTEEEIERAIQIVGDAAQKLRKMSQVLI